MRTRVMFGGVLLLGVVVGLGLMASCGGKSGKVVARVGDRAITTKDLNDQYMAMSSPSRPRQMHTMEGKQRFLEDIINKEIMAGEAYRLRFDDDPGLVKTLKAMTDQEILTILRDENVEQKISIEPGEAQRFYDRMGEEFHLLLLMYGSREEADSAWEQAVQGTPFPELGKESMLAKAYSDADVGWHVWGNLEEPLNEAVFALKAGEITDVVEMPGGVCSVAKVVEIRPKEDLGTFQEMKQGIVDKIRSIKRRVRFNEWTRESVEAYQVELDEEAAKEVLGRLVWEFDTAGAEVRPDFSAEEEARTLGTYRGGRLTIGDFVDRAMMIPRSSRPTSEMGDKEFHRMAQVILLNEALLGEGYASGIHERPEVREKLDRAKEERIVTMLYSGIIKDVVVTDEDIATYYDDFKDSLREVAKYHLSRIVLASRGDAEKALREARSKKSFETVARAMSVDARTAKMGGKLAPATADVLPPEVREIVVTMKKGDIGGPVETEEGWLVIRLDDYTPERELTLDETRTTIRMQLMQSRQNSAFESWLAGKREELGIEIYEDVLEEMELVPDKEEGITVGGGDSRAPGQ
ncbi:MAG: peptidyl-prolyl cis-trans isomerase [Candidatus Eisenbacteria sp.]|nr:peptidyl-prolyl cis-trans isomerase [Candidatus Eisenbacteria bacterium]